MYFMLDENVPADVASMLREQGHTADFVRDYVPSGSPDPVVATVSEQLSAVLLSFDGDFEVISPRVPRGQRRRFRRLSRIWMRCGEPQAANRLQAVLDFVASEYGRVTPAAPMRLTIGAGYLRTDR
jgi:predicted nuclease of predicted toxin-antitoxin system